LPSLSLPKGGGAIRGIGEKFAANPVTGTGSLNVPIYTSPGRSGSGTQTFAVVSLTGKSNVVVPVDKLVRVFYRPAGKTLS
jgi:hypothetical protein